MDCSPGCLGMDPKLLNTIYNQYLRHGQAADVVISVYPDSSNVDGEHFTSHTKRIYFECILAQGQVKRASVIIKTQKSWANSIQARNYNHLFWIEIKMYSTVLPLMMEIMALAGDKREAVWPDIYGCETTDLIALQDLTSLGYAVLDRRAGLNMEDSLLVVRNIARFHAMGKILVDRGSVHLPLNDDSEIVVNKIYNGLFSMLCDSMDTDWGDQWSPMMEWIRANYHDILKSVVQMQQQYDKRFAVVNHGDLWTSNIMFRRTKSKTVPTAVRFVDYQLSSVNSFIWDLEFFFWTSVNSIERTMKNKVVLLTEYQKSLKASLHVFGYSGYVPTLNDVTTESERIKIAGLVYMLFGAVARSDVSRAMDMEKLMTHPAEEFVNKTIFTNQKAQENVGRDLKSLCQRGVTPYFPDASEFAP